MKIKAALILLAPLYILLCIFDYIFINSFDWEANIFESIFVMALIVLFDIIESKLK